MVSDDIQFEKKYKKVTDKEVLIPICIYNDFGNEYIEYRILGDKNRFYMEIGAFKHNYELKIK